MEQGHAGEIPIETGHPPVTAGSVPADCGGMVTKVIPPQQVTSRPALWAVISGVAGLIANVLLVFFFLLARPFSDVQNSFGWLGTANDAVLVVQFLAMIPVALALPRWLPRIRSVRVATAMALGAMLAAAVLQLLLIAGVLDFDVQVFLVVAAFLLVYVWVFVVSSVGHRSGSLPRSVTRFGLLLGASFPLGLLIFTAGLLGLGSPAQLAWLAAAAWLALPIWPLLLARLVFNKPPLINSYKEGLS
jgi:glycopeptide antibiotics resistance protein